MDTVSLLPTIPQLLLLLRQCPSETSKNIHPVSHFSLISIRIALTNLKHELSFGKTPTSFVLLFISLFSLSILLVVRIFFRCAAGKENTVSPSGNIFIHPLGKLRSTCLVLFHNFLKVLFCFCSIRSAEYTAKILCYFCLHGLFGYIGLSILL